MTRAPGDIGELVTAVRGLLAEYGRDYALGAIKGLAVRNMVSVSLPESSLEFYPIVRVHALALEELENTFYSYLENTETDDRESVIRKLAEERVWEAI